MDFDKNYVLAFLKNILAVHSPTGFTDAVIKKIGEYAGQLGYSFEIGVKGTGIITVPGKNPKKTIGVCAHADTLGLMVRSIKSNGMLAVTNIGGIMFPTLDGEYCTVITRGGREYSGTVLCTSPSVHVYADAMTKERKTENMEIRLDEVVKTREDVEALGICAGDYICIDPKTVIFPNGFIKSRFLDDKLGVAVLFGVLKNWKDTGFKPENNVKFIITVYEELGHGMAYVPQDITELVGVDMGCIGDDLSGTEFDACIDVKDAGGPYDYRLTGELISLAKENGLNYAVDVFRIYASDVTAALRAGQNIIGAVFGPGVHASHGMERSHYNAVYNSMRLLALYLERA